MKPLDPRLMRYAKDARGYMAFLVITGTGITAATLAQCIAIAAALAPLVHDGDAISEVLPALAWVVGSFAVKASLQYAQEAFGHRAALRTIADLRGQVLAVASSRGQRWLAHGRTSSTVTLVTEALDDLEPYYVKFLPQLILTSLATPIALAVIMWFDWLSAVAIIVCIPLIPIFMILIGKMTQEYSRDRLASMQRLSENLLDLLAGLATLKALGREKAPKRHVRFLGDTYAAATMKTLYVAFLSGAVLEFLATLSTALVAVEVGFRMVGGHISLFTGLAIIMLTPEALKPLREIGSQFHASADGVTAAQAVFDLLEDDTATILSGSVRAPDLRNASIDIVGLSVQAPGRDLLAPSNLTATITPGSVTVLRGQSGAGKSTTASVLLGFVSPTSGDIRIDGVSITQIDRESLWAQISWVPQRPAIIPGSILENIGVVHGPELEQAAKLTGFDDVVASLPSGWQTRVGHGGVGLSVGQRQRLALTRALVNARPFVLLDEPSAHLDAVSETYVAATVAELKRTGHTVMVIAHRAALIDQADAVIEVVSKTEVPA